MQADRKRVWVIAAASAAAFVLLCLLALWLESASIEQDLNARATAALTASGAQGVTVHVEGRTAVLEGRPTDEASKAAAIGAISALDGIAGVEDRTATAPAGGAPLPSAVYHFDAEWDGRTLALHGQMPTAEARADVVRHARDTFPKVDLVDGMSIAAGAPDELWPAIAMAAIDAFAAMTHGNVTLDVHHMHLKGESVNADGRAEVSDIMQGLPPPYEASFDVTISPGLRETVDAPPPYAFAAAFDGLSVALSGAMPSEPVRSELLAVLATALPGKPVSDRTVLDPSAPDGAWADAMTGALKLLGRTTTARLTVSGREMAFEAVVPDSGARTAIATALAALPAAYQVALRLTVAGQAPDDLMLIGGAGRKDGGPASADAAALAAACQTSFDEALRAAPIVFESASAALPASAAETIRQMANTAATCPGAKLQIAGHTDASGREPQNVSLSADRAKAVATALAAAGVDGARLTAKGFGSTRPVAANDTDENKARNRRIEVIVRP